jgi:hypothetical protein
MRNESNVVYINTQHTGKYPNGTCNIGEYTLTKYQTESIAELKDIVNEIASEHGQDQHLEGLLDNLLRETIKKAIGIGNLMLEEKDGELIYKCYNHE